MPSVIFNPMLKLSNVKRYSGVYLSKPENVAEHTCQTGLMAILIANQFNKKFEQIGYKERVNLEKLALKALVHDVDECTSADIPKDIKYFSPTIRREIGKIETQVINNIAKTFDFSELYDIWKDSKDLTLEGRILKLADMLSVVAKVHDEVNILGNKNVLKVASRLQRDLKKSENELVKSKLDDEVIVLFTEHYVEALQVIDKMISENADCITENYFTAEM